MAALTDRLRKARKARGLSREQLAVAAGCSYYTIVRLETRPTYDPRLSTIRRIADAFRLPLFELLD